MILLVVSASSPLCSAAVFGGDHVLAAAELSAGRQASGTCIALAEQVLAQADLSLNQIEGFGADVGPGSFIGVRVGIATVKAWGFAFGRPVFALSAFDLVPPGSGIASRKGHRFVKRVEGEIELEASSESCTTPVASQARLAEIRLISPEELLPNYILEPSISIPKVPYSQN